MKLKPKSSPRARAPVTLSSEAQGWWRKIVAEWELDDSGLFLLGRALESFDLLRRAQRQLADEGLTVTDRYGVSKPHPAVSVLNGANAALTRYFRALNLDVEPLKDGPGRPTMYGN